MPLLPVEERLILWQSLVVVSHNFFWGEFLELLNCLVFITTCEKSVKTVGF